MMRGRQKCQHKVGAHSNLGFSSRKFPSENCQATTLRKFMVKPPPPWTRKNREISNAYRPKRQKIGGQKIKNQGYFFSSNFKVGEGEVCLSYWFSTQVHSYGYFVILSLLRKVASEVTSTFYPCAALCLSCLGLVIGWRRREGVQNCLNSKFRTRIFLIEKGYNPWHGVLITLSFDPL